MELRVKLFRACCLGSRWHKYKMCVRGGVRIFLCAGFHGSVPSEKPVLGISVVFLHLWVLCQVWGVRGYKGDSSNSQLGNTNWRSEYENVPLLIHAFTTRDNPVSWSLPKAVPVPLHGQIPSP